jgi:transcriptional regulator with GAF, ATPase, and Fis domain
MHSHEEISHRIETLKGRLKKVNRSWTINDYESLLRFYVDIVPKIMDAERCSIFMAEPFSDRIWLKYGTGLKEKEIKPPKAGTVVGRAITSGKWIIENDLGRRPGYHADLSPATKFTTNTIACAPILSLTEHSSTGAIEVMNKTKGLLFSEEDGAILQKIAHYLSMAIENILLNQEILRISGQINDEINQIRKTETDFVAESPAMKNILQTVSVVSTTPVSVLVQGESGTGKEVIAHMIHDHSVRKEKPFVSVNCASIPETLMESEFFGYEKGAFTGAVSSRKGRFEEADGGTLFLDEIGDMPLVIQPKFLRVIQEGEGSRLGSNKSIQYNVRLICASNRDLRKEVAEGRFREDLYYRIFSVEINISPLRERREDIIPLAMLFINKVGTRFQKDIGGFSPEVLNLFEEYPWPGNVRQLLHEVERLVALTPKGKTVLLNHCSPELLRWKESRSLIDLNTQQDLPMPLKIREMEIQCIKDALLKTRGNKLQASRLLGITRQGLDKKIKRYSITTE